MLTELEPRNEAIVRPEPRSMTTVDAMVLTAGAALSLVGLPNWMALAAGYPWTGVGMFLRNSSGFWIAAISLSAVVLARTAQYHRLPRPPEWLAIGAFVWGLTLDIAPSSHEELVQLVGRVVAIFRASEMVARWITAGTVAVLIVGGWFLAREARGILPAWSRTVWLTFLIFLAIWSPLAIFGDHAADWFAPSAGFGKGDAMILYRGVCQWIALTPLALLVGLPVVATVEERLRGCAWTWLEWSSASTAGLAGLLASMVYRGEFRPVSLGWLAERAIATAWVVGVAWVDLKVLAQSRRRGETNSTSVGNPSDPEAALRPLAHR